MSDEPFSPGLEGVTVTRTRLSRVDGEAGELVIGGFPVAELAANATYEEAVYLLVHDRLPDEDELADFQTDLAARRDIGDAVRGVLRQAAAEGRPAMDALRQGVAAADLGRGPEWTSDDGSNDSSDHGDAGGSGDREVAKRVVAVVPTIVATYWRYRQGTQPVAPRADLGHAANYLYMLTGTDPDAAAVGGLETYLTTVVDHGLNASTFTARTVVSTDSDLVSAATAAVGALKGPLHGGAPGPVLDMLQEVHETGDPEGYVRETLDAGERLMGFGHRVYRVRDPRAAVLERAAQRLYGDDDFFDTVREFESVATDLLAEHSPGRTLETNVEYYTAALLSGVGVPRDLFTATFGVARVGGWMAHCLEQRADNRLMRPVGEYVGETGRRWTPVDER